ncbi:SNF1-interacting protein [Entomortierella beljakovae]|nr:SNF1-interacting protein [Entomortierella beljakovae]
MKLSTDAFRTTLALKKKHIAEVSDKVVKPLDDFLKNDLKEFKESKKAFDKALEKYESTLAKYNGQNRQKEPSAIREEAFQLYDTRKAYIQAAMFCSMLSIKFQDALDQLILGVFLDFVAARHDYFSGNADHFASIGLQVLQLKTYMKDHQEASAPTLQELEQNKDRYIADAIEYWKPSRSLRSYTNNVLTPKSAISSMALGTSFATQVAAHAPLTTHMAKPATIPHSTTTMTTRPTIIPQQSQSHPLPYLFDSTSTETQKPPISQSSSMENSPVSEALTINTSVSKPSNPSALSLPPSKSDSNISQFTTPLSTPFGLQDTTPTTKQGYLNIRIPQPKNRAPVWQRKYFFIQEGEFGFESVVSNPTFGSQVVQSERIAVLLCEVRYGSSTNSLVTLSGNGNPASGSQGLAMVQMERRFCFEVVCSTQSYLLQAETEEDLLSWVNTFEAAKRDALLQQCLPVKSEPEEPYSPMIDSANRSFSFSEEELLGSLDSKSNGESEEPKPSGSLGLGWAANVPGVSLLLNSYTGNNISPSNGSSEKNSSSTNQTDHLENTNEINVALDSVMAKSSQPTAPSNGQDAELDSSSRFTGEPPASSGHSQQTSEIERLMTSSLHLIPKAKPPPASEEYVLHSWTSGFRDDSRSDKPIMIYGRIYLTQSGMYFYARGLSVETKRMFRFSNVKGIEFEQKDISTEWRIVTTDGIQHVFCQFTLADTEYQALHLIWTNVHQTKDRLPVIELFRRTLLITSKQKGSAGSGSLAESESGHISSSGDVITNSSGSDKQNTIESTDSILDNTANEKLVVSGEVQSIGDWISLNDQKSRTVKFLMVVNNPLVKLNQTDCVETQACDVEEDHIRYTYTVKSSVLAMPYSDAFTPVLRYCITFVAKNKCKLTCSSSIIWHKNPMVKAMIKGAILKGTAETVKDICEILQLHVAKINKQSSQAQSATTSSSKIGGHGHTQSESSKIRISLHGPDDAQKVLLDPEDQQASDRSSLGRRDSRISGARRHTVSNHQQHQHHGHWPTGSPPLIVQRGPKTSRTRLLERPSKSSLSLEVRSGSHDNRDNSTSQNLGIKRVRDSLLGLIRTKEEDGSNTISTKFIFIVLIISSFVNILAAINSQRMLNSAWRIKEHGILIKDRGNVRGYPEPLDHIIDSSEQTGVLNHFKHRNVRVAARAVHLKDLEERMQNGELDNFDEGRIIDRKCFEMFLEVRGSFRSWPQTPIEWFSGQDNDRSCQNVPESSTTTLSLAQPSATPIDYNIYEKPIEVQGTRHLWLSPRHRQRATRIIFQRDRIGILRHDLLVIFEVLNQLEKRLLEAEYINWIMDERSRCRLWKRRRNIRRLSGQYLKDEGERSQPSTIASDNSARSKSLLGENGHVETKHNAKENIARQIALLKDELTNLSNMSKKSDDNESIQEIMRYIETRSQEAEYSESQSAGENKRERDHGESDSSDTDGAEAKFKDEIAEEFCRQLEQQVELLIIDSDEHY